MTEAQSQIERAVARAKAKGLCITGYHPAVGLPKHPDGSPVLVIAMAKRGRAVAIPEEATKPSRRGAFVEPQAQGSLL